LARFKVKGDTLIPIIGKKPKQEDVQAAALARITKTVPAIVSVCACGTASVSEGIDACSSVIGNLLAQAYPTDADAARAFLDKFIAPGILNFYAAQIKANPQAPAEVQ
jgi:hypothetical protein